MHLIRELTPHLPFCAYSFAEYSAREPLINFGAVRLPSEFVQIKARIAANSGDSWQDPQRRAERIQSQSDAPRID